MKQQTEFSLGVRDSLPVFAGYFAVSFGFGAAAVAYGINPLSATVMSLTNVTSAGEFAALDIIKSGSSLLVMLFCQLVINIRYALMSVSLSQRMIEGFPTWKRMIISFFNTDEIFAIAMARKEELTPKYMYGLGLLPVVGWTAGTLFGSVMSSLLPVSVQTALGVALYGMFVAIVVPQVREDRKKLIIALMAILFSCLFKYLPVFSSISSGLTVAICTVLSAGIGAVLFPLEDKEAKR